MPLWRGYLTVAGYSQSLDPVVEQRRRALYDAGKNDAEIARAEGRAKSAICLWRQARGLHPHIPYTGNKTPEAAAARMLLFTLGYSDSEIARRQRVTQAVVTRWRHVRGFAANRTKMMVGLKRRKADARDDLLNRVQRAIGRTLPPDIAADAVGDICEAILSGKLALKDLEREARRYGGSVLQRFANRFTHRSLDEELGDEDGFTLMSTLVDERSSNWLEEMGATVW